MKDILKDLFNAQAHIGHLKKFRTPQLNNFIHETVFKIDIINLDKTIVQIEKAKLFLKEQFMPNILIVSNKDFDFSDEENIFQIKKWKPGYISNFESSKLEVMPDILIIEKSAYNSNLIKEAKKKGLIIIGVCDTNVPFNIYKDIDYPIVMNDDSSNAVELLINYLIK